MPFLENAMRENDDEDFALNFSIYFLYLSLFSAVPERQAN